MPAAAPALRRSKPTLVLLVRHGATPTTGTVLPGRAPGLHLSDDGRRQADAVAKRIAALARVDAIYSSPLERARETATAIAAARGMSVRDESGLVDCDFGEWTGRSLRRLAKTPEWRLVQRQPSRFRFPGGESFVEMQARVTDAIARLVQRHRGRTIVAVAHADPIKVVVNAALGAPLDLFQRVAVTTASITAIAYGPERPVVLTVNSADGDLAALGIT